MVFAHDTEVSLQAAVALVNSGRRAGHPGDASRTWTRSRRDDYTGATTATTRSWTAVRALRPALRELLTADRDDAVELVNAMLAEHARSPSWSATTAGTGTCTPSSPTRRSPTRIAVETAMAMVDVIRADELSRLGICADDDCDGIVLDLSRNRSRRFCSTTCGNRNAVAAYRARQAQSRRALRRLTEPGSGGAPRRRPPAARSAPSARRP